MYFFLDPVSSYQQITIKRDSSFDVVGYQEISLAIDFIISYLMIKMKQDFALEELSGYGYSASFVIWKQFWHPNEFILLLNVSEL